MTLHRRRILQLAAAAAAAPVLPRAASALDYPTRPVRIFVGYTAGSAPDIASRLIGQSLSDRLGQQFVTENKPGAGTNLSTEAVVRAAPDGYTLLEIATPNTLGNLLHDNLSFDFVRDIAPVGYIGATPFVMVVAPSFPAQTVAEFIAYAKANPGKVNMGSNGTGNLTHISGELFKMMAGVDLFHVPYHGELEAQADLLAGRAHVIFNPIISCLGQIKAGKLRALAVTTPKRIDLAARRADRERDRAGLRGHRRLRSRRAARYAGRDHRQAQCRDQSRAERRCGERPSRRARQHPDGDEPRRLSQADRRRERQVEQGDQVRGD